MKQKISQRNNGIDIAKILSMLMIVIVHLNKYGGILDNVKFLSRNWKAAIVLECICIIGVNVFALISGYLNYEREYKIINIIKLWIQVLFYSITLSIILQIMVGSDEEKANLWKYFFPVSTNQYWYFSCYFFMFMFVPLMNLFVEKNGTHKLMLFLLGIIVLTSIVGFVNDSFYLNQGYSPIWLAVLYIVGASMKKNDKEGKRYKSIINKNIYYLFIFIVCAALNIGVLILLSYKTERLFGGTLRYTFVLNVIGSISFFVYCKNKNFRISIPAALPNSAFSVYLITENYYVRKYLIKNVLLSVSQYNFILMLIAIVMCSIIIYLTCTITEQVRRIIFKYLGFDSFINKIDKKITSIGRNAI